MEIDFIKDLAKGYYSGHNVSEEVKDAWVKGFLFCLNNLKEYR